jgi:hypothetical protein
LPTDQTLSGLRRARPKVKRPPLCLGTARHLILIRSFFCNAAVKNTSRHRLTTATISPPLWLPGKANLLSPAGTRVSQDIKTPQSVFVFLSYFQ